MVGGEKPTFDFLEPIFKTLAPLQGYMYMGESGAGHFVKMVHNGIEYAMMEAYGEGFELLKTSRYGEDMDFSKLSKLWNRGSVIRSWLLELLEDAFEKDNDLSGITGHVDDSGEGRWTVQEAIELRVAVPGYMRTRSSGASAQDRPTRLRKRCWRRSEPNSAATP